MADLNALYNDFNERIKLTSAKSKSLKTGRDSIRELIRDKFSDNGRNKPKFRMQGSFSMKTTVNPIGDEEYDLDDGVYLQGYSNADEEDWPEPADTHKWVIDAVDGHTSSDTRQAIILICRFILLRMIYVFWQANKMDGQKAIQKHLRIGSWGM